MYTQCPECGVAFRVTADVLKMAAGKVRCGGCGSAFNALEHLSESKPAPPTRRDEMADPDLPRLTPEDSPELEADTPPQTISAEQSAALLKTLDELAAEDIPLEETGAEPPQAPGDEPSQVIDEMLFDDDTVLPDDFDAVVEAPSQPKPVEPVAADDDKPEPPQFDLDLSDPDEWDDLLGDLQETADEVAPPDMDTQFAIQAEAMGIDVSGMHEKAGFDEEPEDLPDSDEPAGDLPGTGEAPDLDTSIEEDLIAAAFETEAAARAYNEADDDEDEADDDILEDIGEDIEIDLQVEEDLEAEDDIEDIAQRFDDKVEEDIATLSMSLDDTSEQQGIEDEAGAEEPLDEELPEEAPDDGGLSIPEMTEEEKTINMMIDEELFAIAVEDEDGFASTIVQLQPDDKVEKEIAEKDSGKKKDKKDEQGDKDKKKKDKDKKDRPPAHAPAVETIIMEGEFIRAELDKEKLAADKAASESAGLAVAISREKDDYERRREMTSTRSGPGAWAGIVALVLLLGIQAIHQSRDALATVPAFNSAVGPLYRMLGRPLAPAWDIAGWRFEATKGDTDESGDVLTIYSRIGNNADEPLPYPLVHLSLTDRFEDVIGSAVLEPGEYLPENADPRKPVPPGNTFNAVISIESPSAEATGFKLNVCYRLASGQLRCANHDFK